MPGTVTGAAGPSATERPIFSDERPKIGGDIAGMFAKAARQPGLSTPKLAARMLRSLLSAQRMPVGEFFRLGMQRPGLSRAELDAILSRSAMTRLNRLLNGPAEGNEAELLTDKLATGDRLAAAGLPVARVRAVYPSALATGGAAGLDSAGAIAAFLLAPGNTPCFGKPVYGAFSKGVAAIEAATPDGMLHLGDGRQVDARRYADEVVAGFGQGYMFQDLLRAGDTIRAMSGPVLPSIRLFSMWLSGVPHLTYVTFRLPPPGAMIDDGAHEGSIRLFIDPPTGRVLRAQDMMQPAGTDTLTAPITGMPLPGAVLPHWPEVLALHEAVHRDFPRHPSIGSDIAYSDQGLIVNEVNAHAQHFTYQMVSGEGILNPRLRPLFRQVIAERGQKWPGRGWPWP